MFRVCVVGANGRMGKEICKKIISKTEMLLVAATDEKLEKVPSVNFLTHKNIFETNGGFDLIIDFSSAENVKRTLSYAKKFNKKLICGITGLKDEEMDLMKETSKSIPIFYSGNMSSGIFAMIKSVKMLSKALMNENFDIDIIDIHHKKKLDAPSGTALLFAKKISEENEYKINLNKNSNEMNDDDFLDDRNEINFSSIRSGKNFGEHIIIFTGENEIFEMKHKAYSKDVFVDGVIKAAMWIINKGNGFYGMDDLYS